MVMRVTSTPQKNTFRLHFHATMLIIFNIMIASSTASHASQVALRQSLTHKWMVRMKEALSSMCMTRHYKRIPYYNYQVHLYNFFYFITIHYVRAGSWAIQIRTEYVRVTQSATCT
ncbi:uncharacterized protein PHALS_15164 [Plasmopara halstedii]|uniref:Uncharacterized protein n=1 Tax=Plasmopara halstedii TaxID=4781 RepID=A0A0N7L829_PLAHL|nr:uncharacterized protein PHALS_15164 [Plasmopara halstedii]CEG48723.1 hypothetical protein PHALS_15164 [Plasmopara halstedii]|eukprot:XP_024585092.1 hypothetical protein PHALS_15164 [Plasmopara halstedii]